VQLVLEPSNPFQHVREATGGRQQPRNARTTATISSSNVGFGSWR
jgi:hypothetical protein